MLFTLIAAAVGLVVGLVGGGNVRRLGERRFALWPLLPLGIALQLPLADRLGFAGLLVSYACLLGFALANVRLVGMGVVAVGVGLNMVPIAVNRGMPVDREAVVSARISTAADVNRVRTDRKHHLQRRSDRLTVLGDIIPVAPLREVISFGDIVLSIGVGDVLFHLMRSRPAHSRDPAGRDQGTD